MANVNEGSSAADMVTCTIDGVEVSVPKGTRIIEAAEGIGLGIAHYCYHPALSAPAMCRMCLVEVEGAPKLAPACVTTVGDGQVINTESERALKAREGTLEFYLFNHPLDCPICDKSGECKLQDFVHSEGRARGRSLEAKRVLGQDDFGGDILYDGDRCIMCTRCVRFMREIGGEDALCVVQRGHRSVIDTFYDEGVGENLWAGNIVDICPVGALLSKDFLHKARVWDLDRTPSVCASCSQGCNIYLDGRDNAVARLRPRQNAEVNSYWMCDYGRYNYEWLNRQPRLESPLVGGAESAWQAAVISLVERLKALPSGTRVRVVGSAVLGNEDNGLLARLAEVVGDGEAVFRSSRAADEETCPGFPALRRRRDLAANVKGLELMGFSRVGDDEGHGGLAATAGEVLIVLGDDLADLPEGFARGTELFVHLTTHASAAASGADYVLPVTLYAEQEGTFTNADGRVQRFWPGLQPPAMARPAWQVLGVLLAGLGDGAAPADAGNAFLRVAQLHDAFAGLSYENIGARGALVNELVRLGAGAVEEG
ncbi:MAG: 2Fe-2S iron-sulfur cluster-binding protein [Gemmatimonadota bacterium]